jgi:putative pyoverdin transport system ATP-binding/permease protein
MEFIRFLQKESGAAGRKIALVTLFGGSVSGLIVTVILGAATKATEKDQSFRYLLMFGVALAAILAAKRYSLRATNLLTESIVERIRLRITDKIRRADLQFFERTGSTQFFSLLTKETQTISSTAGVAINAASALVMLAVSFCFIAYLSPIAFMLTMVAIGTGVVAYRVSLEAAGPQMRETIRIENTYFDLIHHLLAGFKELKMNAVKNRDFYDNHLQPLSEKVRTHKVATNNLFVTTTLIMHGAFYALLGVVIFLLPRLASVEQGTVMKISAVILFTFGPLLEVIGVIPSVAQAGAAIHALEAMEKNLDAELGTTVPVNFGETPAPWVFRELEAQDLVFSYPDEAGVPGYTVGPINLKVSAGEIVFLMGGNGSGKSTFLKLLTGLYTPRSGRLLVNGQVVTPMQLPRFRNLFSIIFTDFHLFDRLYGLPSIDDAQLNQLLADMDIANKTSYYEGRFSTLQLSTGQRKRLALIVAVLERKPILVCDEWAADQDPQFRKHFYEVILRELKEQGKTIIAATHDDHYFNAADRLLKMEYGQIVASETPAH